MKQLGAFEAKTHFSELLTAVVQGEKFIITKHGNQVAMLVPFKMNVDSADPIKGAIRAIKKLRKGLIPGENLSVNQMKSEGRR